MPFSQINIYSSSVNASGDLAQTLIGERYVKYNDTYSQPIESFQSEQYIYYSVAQSALNYGLNSTNRDYKDISSVSYVQPSPLYYGERPCYTMKAVNRCATLGGNEFIANPITFSTYDTAVFNFGGSGGIGNFMLTKLNYVLPGYPDPEIQSDWTLYQDRMEGSGYWNNSDGPGGCNEVSPQCYSYFLAKWTYSAGNPVGGEVLRVSFDRPGGGGSMFATDEQILSNLRAQYASGSLTTASKPARGLLNFLLNRSSVVEPDYNLASGYAVFGNVITNAFPDSAENNTPINFFQVIGGKGR
jgi:hypothetical protein